MKNINTTTITTASMTGIAAIHEAAKAARKAYEDARDKMVKDIVAQLPTDADAPVLNVDLARAAGLAPTHMASLMNRNGYGSGVATRTVTKVRRFVEVDEDGQILKNGGVKEQRSELVAYYKDTSRRW